MLNKEWVIVLIIAAAVLFHIKSQEGYCMVNGEQVYFRNAKEFCTR